MAATSDISALAPTRVHDGPEAAAPPVCLLDVDFELAADLNARANGGGPELTVPVPARTVARGDWTPSPELRKTLALYVIDGVLLRDDAARGPEHLALFGPGDLIDLHSGSPTEQWTVRRRATIAALDGHIVGKARDHPQLLVALLRRLLAAGQEREALTVIARRTRVNDRLLALLTHFASRWGRVTADGVAVDVPLTHSELGRLIGARRPTVTIAIAQLVEDGALQRLDAGQWLVTRLSEVRTSRFERSATLGNGAGR